MGLRNPGEVGKVLTLCDRCVRESFIAMENGECQAWSLSVTWECQLVSRGQSEEN